MSFRALRHPLVPSPSSRRTGAVLCLLAVAGCSSGAAAGTVTVPRPPAAQARLCGALHGALPAKVDGLRRHATRPASDLTAAWGSPAIVLRCGVPRPPALTPGGSHYDPTADAAEIDGVDWLPQRLSDGSVRCTTTMRRTYVEVTIPRAYAGPNGDMGSLTDLASAIGRTVPSGL